LSTITDDINLITVTTKDNDNFCFV